MSYKASDVWAASAAAYRINKGYVASSTTPEVRPNKLMVKEYLDNGFSFKPDDHELGNKVRAYWQNFGKTAQKISEFEQKAIDASNLEELTLEVATVAGCFKSAVRDITRQKLRETSRYQGAVGDSVVLNQAVVSDSFTYSGNNRHCIQAIVDGNAYNWWDDNTFEIGKVVTIKGTVSKHVEDTFSGIQVTQINNVEFINSGTTV